MARRKKREETPVKSNRGRLDARGVFIVFDVVADEPLTRSGDGSGERTAAAGSQREVRVDETVSQ